MRWRLTQGSTCYVAIEHSRNRPAALAQVRRLIIEQANKMLVLRLTTRIQNVQNCADIVCSECDLH